MKVDTKDREAIINAIRVLRLRRVRPSGQKISSYLKRQHIMQEETTIEVLDELVRSCDILRVEYKGATSYRVAKTRSSKCSSKTTPLDGHSVRQAILSAVATCGTSGGTRNRIAACLQSRGLDKLVDRLDVILQREARIGELTKKVAYTKDDRSYNLYAIGSRSEDKIDDCHSSSSETDPAEDPDDEKTQAPFQLLQQHLKLLQKRKNCSESQDFIASTLSNEDNADPKEREDITLVENDNRKDPRNMSKRGRPRKLPLHVKDNIPKRKGRPPSKRTKKEKKVYDPSESGTWKKRRNGFSLGDISPVPSNKCGVCNSNESDILSCNLCSTKAHPKCVGYGEELASKILNWTWTCMDCKSCSICTFNHRIGTLIFCDKCDRAFHITCHCPPLAEFPKGAWVCFMCTPRVEGNVYEPLIPWLPTPVNSPEMDDANSETSESAETVPDAADWSVEAVVEYFQKRGFEQFASVFKEQEIDGVALLILSRDDALHGLGLKLGPALRIFRQIRILQTRVANPPL